MGTDLEALDSKAPDHAGTIVFLTTAVTELLLLSRIFTNLPQPFSSIKARDLNEFESIEDFERFVADAPPLRTIVVARLLGGKRSLKFGFESFTDVCSRRRFRLICCSGERTVDEELEKASNVEADIYRNVFAYLAYGGQRNLYNLLLYLSDKYFGTSFEAEPPEELPWHGIYDPSSVNAVQLDSYPAEHWIERRPSVAILFYRASWAGGDLAHIDLMIRIFMEENCNVLPIFCYSSKDNVNEDVVSPYLLNPDGTPRIDCVVNTLSFSSAQLSSGAPPETSLKGFRRLRIPVIQAIICSTSIDDWERSTTGLTPLDLVMKVTLPEFDGHVLSVPIAFRSKPIKSELTGLHYRTVGYEEGIRYLVASAKRVAALRHKPNSEKKIAIILSNYPSKDGRIGNAVGLDTQRSVVNLLKAMKDRGYKVHNIPDSDRLMKLLLERPTNDEEFNTPDRLCRSVDMLGLEQYGSWFGKIPEPVKHEMKSRWGEPQDDPCFEDGIHIPGIILGNVLVTVQPPRGYGDNPIAIYHSPDLPPTHKYLAFYRWIAHVFGADVVIHLGKHGNLEWLPGKGVALSPQCYPKLVLLDLPNFYPFIINNPGEGTQAKRRTHATIIDHLTPPMTKAETYGELAKLEQLMDEYFQMQTLDPKKIPILESKIWEIYLHAHLDKDLKIVEKPDDFVHFLNTVDGYICELKIAQIKDGLHVLGEPPQGKQLIEMLQALTRLDNYGIPSLRRSLAEAYGLDYDKLSADPTKNCEEVPKELAPLGNLRIQGDIIEALDRLGFTLLQRLDESGYDTRKIESLLAHLTGRTTHLLKLVLEYVATSLYPKIMWCTREITSLLEGLEGQLVEPGPSGAPSRGMANILPTGRNFYTVDIRGIPSQTAWEIGKRLGDELLRKYLEEHGRYPETVGMVVWGTSNMRTQGDDIAEILYLLGVRPVWHPESRRVKILETIPLEELGRPRIDVMVRISGFFRDAFPNLVQLINDAVAMVSQLTDEPAELNYVASHVRKEIQQLIREGQSERTASERCLYRVFGAKPGAYGVGLLHLINQRNWKTDKELADVYLNWSGYAYTKNAYGTEALEELKRNLSKVEVAVKNQDNREHDIFDSDDYFQEHGGMIASVRALTSRNPASYLGDSSDPSKVVVRDTKEEARRVFRTRAVNPKWIASIMKHGYRGASEIAATVDYMFGYDATAQICEDWMYEKLAETYLFNEELRRFLEAKNPWVLRDITERLIEAIERDLWKKPSESTRQKLTKLFLRADAVLEATQLENGKTNE